MTVAPYTMLLRPILLTGAKEPDTDETKRQRIRMAGHRVRQRPLVCACTLKDTLHLLWTQVQFIMGNSSRPVTKSDLVVRPGE